MVSRRGILAILMTAMAAAAGGCVRNVRVTPVLPVVSAVSREDLVARLNAYGNERTISAPVSLQFRDVREAALGKNKQYPAADGRLVLERPNKIRLLVKVPVVGTKIADMVSDGEKFQLKLLYPENKRKFVVGSNAGNYKRVEADTQSADPTLQSAGTLANIRPQHLTEAFLIQPFAVVGETTVYFLDEVQQNERDTRPGAHKGDEVVRTYYVLTLLERIDGGQEARVLRRIWFDRTKNGTPLARQEVYENGRIATRVSYTDFFQAETGELFPGRVNIERLADGYSVDVIVSHGGLDINGDVPETAFTLRNDEGLEEVDLDKMPGVVARPGGAGAPAAR